MSPRDLLSASRRELAALVAAGHPVDPQALDDSEYRGTSLGMPAIVERLTWKTFKKAFHRDPETGALRGWNIRLEQHGVGGPCVPVRRAGRPFTFGHFGARAAPPRAPRGLGGALLLDYGIGGNHPLDPTAVVRDVLVALEPGRFERLLGWMYLECGPLRVPTPSYFLLERDGPLGEAVASPRG